MAHTQNPAGPAPTRRSLHEAALRHLARYGTTEAALLRVLERRVIRWGQRAALEGIAVDGAVTAGRAFAQEVAHALVVAGVVNDQAFAEQRAARLVRTGRSRRAVAAHLASKGIPAETAAAAMDAFTDEVPSALAYARKRRLGPFRKADSEGDSVRDLAALARAGFSRETAEQALKIPIHDAELMVTALKRS